jgi:hypothetical protein
VQNEDINSKTGGITVAGNVQYSFQRVEKKYMLTRLQYEAVVEGLGSHMKANEYGHYTISNLYYDTEDYRVIRASLEKPVYKEKLRLRGYGVPGDGDRVYVELKKKCEGVVYKRRVSMTASQAMDYLGQGVLPQDSGQIQREIDWYLRTNPVSPKVFLAYDREAYAGIQEPELRITFDTGIRWRTEDLDLRLGDQGTALLDPNLVLMEIKAPGAVPLWLANLLSETEAYPTSFSKYGTYYKQQVAGKIGVPALTAKTNINKEACYCA